MQRGIPDKWFVGCEPLNEPDSQNDTLWKCVLWSGSGYSTDPYLFYAPRDLSEWQLEVLVAALEKNGITGYFEDDYYWNNPDIETELAEAGFTDVDELMDAYNDIYIDGTREGASQPHVLRCENFKIEPADKPIEYYTGNGNISDSRRRVKDAATHKMYMCDVWVDLTEKDKNELYDDVYISKSNGKRYNSEDWSNGELDLEGEFQPTFDDAFDEAIRLCYKLAEKFPNDPYIINIDEFDVDDETGDTDNADSYASYNAWYNEHTGKISWV